MIINTREHISTFKAQPGEKAVTMFNGFVKFNGNNLMCIAASPGMGKTSLALYMALEYAKRSNNTVYIFSPELSAKHIYNRMISALAEVNMHLDSFSEKESEVIAKAKNDLKNLSIVIDDEIHLTVEKIKERIQDIDDLGLVIIDNFQLLESEQKEINRLRECYEITRQLKILSKKINIPIVFTSHLNNHRLEQREDKRPWLSDLADTGVMEIDVDTVIFLYRDEYYNENLAGEHTKAEVIIRKNRHGSCGTVQLEWYGKCMKFSENDKEN